MKVIKRGVGDEQEGDVEKKRAGNGRERREGDRGRGGGRQEGGGNQELNSGGRWRQEGRRQEARGQEVEGEE